jgi:oligoendopeptidase F
MLTACSTIIESAITNQSKLLPRRSTWAPPYFDNFKKRIDAAFQNHLGIDSAKDLRQSTQVLLGIQKQALKDLALVKVQIDEDFKKEITRRIEILKQLGFTTYLKDAQRKDQEAMINLLYMFKQNLPGLRAEIEAKGTDKASLDNIVGYADTLKNANVTQETFKGGKKAITAEAVTEFNEIYDELIKICKIAAKFLAEEPALKDQFTYSKVLKALNFKPGDGGGGDAPKA